MTVNQLLRRAIAVGAVFALGVTMAPVGGAAVPPATVTSDQAFVIAATHDFLGRAPTAQELVADTATSLSSTNARAAVVRKLAFSNEFVTREINTFYQLVLRRSSDEAGLLYWADKVVSGRTNLLQIPRMLYASTEYFQRFGSSDNAHWVVSVYRDLLGRNAFDDLSGAAYWVSLIPRVGRGGVMSMLYQSSEATHNMVASLYELLLGRAPDQAGWDYWASRIYRVGYLTLAVLLSSSSEYDARAFSRYGSDSVPSEPQSVTGSAGTNAATVSWNAPDIAGGFPITGYQVTSIPGGRTCSTTGATTCTIAGLDNNTTYRFQVTASNAIGTGLPSDPSGPVTPTLLGWSPPDGAIPANGTVLYLDLGPQGTQTFTRTNSIFGEADQGSSIDATFKNLQNVSLHQNGLPTGSGGLQTGYWHDVDSSSFVMNPPGFCASPSTDLQVDDVQYGTDATLQQYVVRFVETCSNYSTPVRGYFRYDATDTSTPPPPGNPADFTWQPPTGSVPATGNFLYLQGIGGDYISGGNTYLLSSGATFNVGELYGQGRNVAFGAQDATNNFSVWLFGQITQQRLTVGLYSNVLRAPFNDPVTGGFSVTGDGRGCNDSYSTFAVDSISYDDAGNLQSISARFVQHCEQPTAAPLYGALRYTAPT